MTETTTTTTKKAPEVLTDPATMQGEALAKFNAMTPSQQTIYRARYAAQAATEALAKAKKDEEDARTNAKRTRYLEAGEKKLAQALRLGEIAEADLPAKIATLAITGTGAVAFDVQAPATVREELKVTPEESAPMIARIKEAAKKAAPAGTSTAKTVPAPSFTLGYELRGLKKADFLPPNDGGRPDATLTALILRYGQVLPFTVLPATAEGKYPIFDGKRRFHLLKEDETVAAVILSGFPDEGTQEAVELAVNRARSLNVLRAGQIITAARAAKKSDTQIRVETGLKTGEVEKYASALSLPPAILQGIKDGRITANTALSITKQPAHIQERLAADFADRRGKETESAPARITEADVDALRTAQSEAAIKRDGAALSELTQGVTQEDATGGGTPVNP